MSFPPASSVREGSPSPQVCSTVGGITMQDVFTRVTLAHASSLIAAWDEDGKEREVLDVLGAGWSARR